MAKRRIMILSPHALLREGLIQLLAESPDFELLAAVSSLGEAETAAATCPPDVIVFSCEDTAVSIPLRLLELAGDRVIKMTLDDKGADVYSHRRVTLDTLQDLYQVLQGN